MSARFFGPFIASVIGVVGGVYTFKPALVEERNRRITKIHERATPPEELPSRESRDPPTRRNSNFKPGSSSR
ncbi:MAG: hypothetical protein GOMPHAMPRED_006194 [Gomphillus americanus]|uniref:Uncharacterized protein n=1 Tax=Gomphillus americanus TaxID=1940652 RepID=A0A8H3EN79_9LECA|nr:MAG: hypothetical protein GOMPHAMPRED_006194 [Gomphillus americanus]